MQEKNYETVFANYFIFNVRLVMHKKEPIEESSKEDFVRSITVNESISMFQSNQINLALAASTTSKYIDFGTLPNVSSFLFSNGPVVTASGIEVRGTHGHMFADKQASPQIVLSAMAYGNYNSGSGLAIKYPFKKGKTYKIRTKISNHPTVIPANLDFQLVNQLPSGQLCSREAPGVTLSNESPIITKKPNGKISDITMDFTPTTCYDFLMINCRVSQAGTTNQTGNIHNIFIDETPILELNGTDNLAIGAEGTIHVTASCYQVSENFNWSVSGNIEIVGSNIGPTVTVKSTAIGGAIFASLDRCANLLSKNISTGPTPVTGFSISESYTNICEEL